MTAAPVNNIDKVRADGSHYSVTARPADLPRVTGGISAGRVVAAGRNPRSLAELPALGADAVISLDQPDADLTAAFAAEAGEGGTTWSSTTCGAARPRSSLTA